jgi:ElaB/YqjD/DUF883 family membrane-anchored ribosome-binding protein
MAASHASGDSHSGNGSHAVKRKVDAVVESVKDLGSATKKSTKKKMSRARDTADKYIEKNGTGAISVEHWIAERIRRDPTQALLIAASIGFFAGFMLRRR